MPELAGVSCFPQYGCRIQRVLCFSIRVVLNDENDSVATNQKMNYGGIYEKLTWASVIIIQSARTKLNFQKLLFGDLSQVI